MEQSQDQKRLAAEERQRVYDSMTTKEKLEQLEYRPGNNLREKERLLKRLEVEALEDEEPDEDAVLLAV